MKRITFALLALALTGCGKGLFSVWTEESSGNALDLSEGKIGAFTMFALTPDGGKCSFIAVVTGTEDFGKAVVGDASPKGCAALNGTYEYNIEDSRLKLCKTTGACATYK